MGSVLSICFSHEKQEESPKKEYSWDKCSNDPTNYIIQNLNGMLAGRLPGEIDGNQFIIENCQNSYIYLFDNINTITVDDCMDCHIIIGPCENSAFLRNCKNCKVMLACQQFRARDCARMDIFLWCNTQPVIESSSGMNFAVYSLHYKELKNQLRAAKLDCCHSTWSDIYDFTPRDHGNNFGFMSIEVEAANVIMLPNRAKTMLCPMPGTELSKFDKMEVTFLADYSNVLQTVGPQSLMFNKETFPVVMTITQSERQEDLAFSIARHVHHLKLGYLRYSKVMKLDANLLRVLNTSPPIDPKVTGLVIVLEFISFNRMLWETIKANMRCDQVPLHTVHVTIEVSAIQKLRNYCSIQITSLGV